MLVPNHTQPMLSEMKSPPATASTFSYTRLLHLAWFLIAPACLATTGFADLVEPVANPAAAAEWWTGHLDAAAGRPPFSFIYDGTPSAQLLASWTMTYTTKQLNAAQTQTTCVWRDPACALEVRCVAVRYADFPAVEWTVYFRNQGTANTGIIADIQGLDANFARKGDTEFVLHGINGDWASRESYQPYEIKLTPGLTEERRPNDSGKSCDGPKGWPYFNLQQIGGVMLAVGWPGQWRARFERDTGTTLRVRAGQENTRLYLKPGEEVRSPLIAMLFWKGTDVAAAQNLWRRWMVVHNLPRTGDGRLPPDEILGNSSHQFAEMTKATEENQIQFIDSYLAHGVKIDYWWMDAGWYPCEGDWLKTGTWVPDRTRFPHGLRGISDHAHARDVKTIVWFEPERVGDPNSWLSKNHPEWLLPGSTHGSILNLGSPAALAWLINHVDGLIKSEHIDLYREDMNGSGPLGAWRILDHPGREGFAENQYIQGHLAFWDELRRRNPELRIDSCASGGRRNDLESMRRAVPLLRSDYLFEPTGQQAHTYGLSAWLPYQGTGYLAGASVLGLPGADGINVYAFRSTMCVSHTISVDARNPNVDWALLKRLEDQHRQIGPLFLQDYYPLTPYSLAPDQWMAWQFNDPELGAGMVQAFRRENCSDKEKSFLLCALDPSATYELVDMDSGRTLQRRGAELMADGLVVALGDCPGAAIITYRRLR